jgi:hypothetical protein
MDPVFPPCRGGWGEFLKNSSLFSMCSNMFSSCSLEVPQVLKLFLKVFPIASQFYSIWFAQSSTLTYISFHWRVLNGPKKVADGSMNMALSTKKKEKRKSSEHTHELINMSHTTM